MIDINFTKNCCFWIFGAAVFWDIVMFCFIILFSEQVEDGVAVLTSRGGWERQGRPGVHVSSILAAPLGSFYVLVGGRFI